MRDISPESPEARRQHPDGHPHRQGFWGHLGPGSRPFETTRRVAVGVYNEGFVHAGNLAYLTLLSLFPFFIIVAAVAQFIGGPAETARAIQSITATLPPSVASLVASTATEVVSLRTGPLLWLGAAIGLWTVGSFIETIREILRRAYGTDYSRSFWHYRLIGIAMIMAAVILLLAAFSAQLALTAADELLARFVPAADSVTDRIGQTRFVPLIVTFLANYLLFWTLTPSRYRGRRYPKWPGAVFTTAWWFASLTLLPRVIEQFGGYTLTYGSLAGVMVALLFFWLVGYGLVIGAHLNAALANPEDPALQGASGVDEMMEARWLDT